MGEEAMELSWEGSTSPTPGPSRSKAPVEDIPRQTTENPAAESARSGIPSKGKKNKKKLGKKGPGSKHEEILRGLLEEDKKKATESEAVLKSFAAKISKEFAEIEKRTGLRLEAAMKKVFGIVQSAVAGTTKNPEKKAAKGAVLKAPRKPTGEEEVTQKGAQQRATQQQNASGQKETNQPEEGWKKVIGRNYWPKDQKEAEKAQRRGPVQGKPSRDLRVFMRFEGKAIPDEVWVRGVTREVLEAHGVGHKGILNVIRTERTIAVSCKGPWWQEQLLKISGELQRIVGFTSIERAEKWDKFLFRNVVYRRTVNGKEGLMDVPTANYEVSTLHGHQPMRTYIFKNKDREDFCNVLFFFKEGNGPKSNVRLFGSNTGGIKLGERGRPRLCRNCKTFHLGLCRREAKCSNCGQADHDICEYVMRCAMCHSRNHKSDDPACPLRPSKKADGWHYANAWTVATRRRQEDEKAARTKKREEKIRNPSA